MTEEIRSFEEAYSLEKPESSFERGIMDVPLNQITGTVGRYRDFDEGFNVFSSDSKRRLQKIREALIKGADLPPLELYKLKDSYFILDGHHRVTIARQMGIATLRARVIEYLPPRSSMENVLARQKSEFELLTGLNWITLTELSQYDKLLSQIREHVYYLNEKDKPEGTFKDGAADWYTKVYAPIAARIEEENLLKDFPGRTTDDLYVYLSDHKWMESQRRGYDIGFAAAIDTFHRKGAGRSLKDAIMEFFSSFKPISARRRSFEGKTGLRAITVSDEQAYRSLMKQIREHRYYLSQRAEREIPLQEAASHWYHEIYVPVIKIIEEERFSSGFPMKTSSDLYLSISELKWLESEKRGYDIGFLEALKEYKKQQHDPRLRDRIRNLLARVRQAFIEGKKSLKTGRSAEQEGACGKDGDGEYV